VTKFRVDTHLFRELGELLVGRDSTALAELIKNAYDADANNVWVSGLNLDDPHASTIVIRDDGNGMTFQQFERGYLTIASRAKSEEARYSPRYGRRFTGAKGIGRLAAHKLAHELNVTSIPISNMGAAGVRAMLDWDYIESFENLDDLDGKLPMEPIYPDAGITSHGTTVELRRLRGSWTRRDLDSFVSQVGAYTPRRELYELPESDAPTFVPPLLTRPVQLRGSSAGRATGTAATMAGSPPLSSRVAAGRFEVHLEGDFASGESLTADPSATAEYVLEIASSTNSLDYGIARTASFSATLPEGLRTAIPTVSLPPLEGGPYFSARIFAKSGRRTWDRAAAGVRVYMEGFRVLPYGDERDDWLEIDAQYTERRRELATLGERFNSERLFGTAASTNEGLSALPNNGYLGGVFLTEDASGGLTMLINREGFVPGPEFSRLSDSVKRGIDYLTRARARDKAAAAALRAPRRGAVAVRGRSESLTDQARRLDTLTHQVREDVRSRDALAALDSLARAADLAQTVAGETDDILTELNMIRVLASVSTQLSAFVHELNSLLAGAETAQSELKQARAQLDPSGQRATAEIVQVLEELRRGLERQASYLVDVTSTDARRRRSKQRLAERVGAVFNLLSVSAAARSVELAADIDVNIRTRPMFRAELTAILTNVLTNAIKAAATDDDTQRALATGCTPRRVLVDAHVDGPFLAIRVSNTGAQVNPADGERWFEPYASTTKEIDPVLGQGTGLGLTITRSLVAENAGTIHFVTPRPPFATALEIKLPIQSGR